MSFVQWRQFNFFTKHLLKEAGNESSPNSTETVATLSFATGRSQTAELKRLQQLDDDHLAHSELQSENISEHLSKIMITCSGAARGSLVLGDENGFIHIIDRQLKLQSFQPFLGKLVALQLLHKISYLIVAGQNGSIFQIKIFNIEKFDPNKLSPQCIRTIKSPSDRAAISSLAVNEYLSLLLIGFNDGQLAIVRGDLTRERSTRVKLLNLSNEILSVNGIFLKQIADTQTSSWQLGNRLRGFTRQNQSNQSAIVFVVTDRSIYCLQLKAGNETLSLLESEFGCSNLNQCALINEELAIDNSLFVVGRSNAVYFYHLDGQGPCLAFEGEKNFLHWHKGYLVIVTNEQSSSHSFCTVYDIQNKFIAYSNSLKPFPRIKQIFSEWGAIVLLTETGELIELQEKDMSSKLELLFKKQQYSLAIELAKAQQYSQESLMDIFKEYADHLYRCGDHEGAINQYINTIGKLEPSYVIRKYLTGQKVRALTVYLEEMHRRQVANQEHTTLLINCYAKLKDIAKLNTFLRDNYADDGEHQHGTNNNKKNKNTDTGTYLQINDETLPKKRFFFDVPTAIHVLRQSKLFQEALFLAEKHFCFDLYFSIQMEDLHNFLETLQFVHRNFIKQTSHCPQTSELIRLLERYGRILLSHEPDATFELLKNICDHMEKIQQNQTKTSNDVLEMDDINSALNTDLKVRNEDDNETSIVISVEQTVNFNPADFIEIFVQNPSKKREFLQYIIEKKPSFANSAIYTAFLDLNLKAYCKEPIDSPKRKELRNKILEILKSQSNYDVEQAVLFCQMANFRDGVICLYERMEMYELLLWEHMQADNPSEHQQVLDICNRFGDQNPFLWLNAFFHFVKLPYKMEQFEDLSKLNITKQYNAAKQLEIVIDEILDRKLISMTALINTLCNNPNIPLSLVSNRLSTHLSAEDQSIQVNEAKILEYEEETEKIKNLLDTIETQPRVFQSSKCAICNNPLDLPVIHFLCLHAFHRDCFESHSGDHETVCPVCLPEQRRVSRMYDITHNLTDAQLHSQFIKDLNDPNQETISVLAQYFGKNIIK